MELTESVSPHGCVLFNSNDCLSFSNSVCPVIRVPRVVYPYDCAILSVLKSCSVPFISVAFFVPWLSPDLVARMAWRAQIRRPCGKRAKKCPSYKSDQLMWSLHGVFLLNVLLAGLLQAYLQVGPTYKAVLPELVLFVRKVEWANLNCVQSLFPHKAWNIEPFVKLVLFPFLIDLNYVNDSYNKKIVT